MNLKDCHNFIDFESKLTLSIFITDGAADDEITLQEIQVRSMMLI